MSKKLTSAKFYFNLVSDREVISDDEGINLSTEGDVVSHVVRALEDLRQDGFLASPEWQGWKMVVTNCVGQTLVSVALG